MTDVVIPRLGVPFVPTLAPERLPAIARAVEESGLDELWVWEDCFKESGVAAAAVALSVTSRIRVGIGLLPAPLRAVSLTAMEIATLDRIFPERLATGIGHGVQSWMAQVGGRAESPMTLLREYFTALRRLLAGEKVSVQGRYVKLDEVQLDWPPASPPPLLSGGQGPKTLALSAELADGTLLAAFNEEGVREASEVVKGVRSRLGSTPHEILAGQIAATGAGAQERVDTEIPKWGGTPGPGAGVAGDAEAIAGMIRRLAGFGATTVTIQPTEDEPDLEGFIHFLGQEVRPLLG
ncbi:LLM class flavin-dependent oxidoreductase [Flindersiella endophytica]